MWDVIYLLIAVLVGALAFFIGKKFAGGPKTESKTTTFLIKSIQAIAELAVLEYVTDLPPCVGPAVMSMELPQPRGIQ